MKGSVSKVAIFILFLVKLSTVSADSLCAGFAGKYECGPNSSYVIAYKNVSGIDYFNLISEDNDGSSEIGWIPADYKWVPVKDAPNQKNSEARFNCTQVDGSPALIFGFKAEYVGGAEPRTTAVESEDTFTLSGKWLKDKTVMTVYNNVGGPPMTGGNVSNCIRSSGK